MGILLGLWVCSMTWNKWGDHPKRVVFFCNDPLVLSRGHSAIKPANLIPMGKDIERKIYDIFQQLERKNMKWRTMIKCGEINNKIRTNTERKQQRQPIDLRWRDGDVRK